MTTGSPGTSFLATAVGEREEINENNSRDTMLV